MGYKDYIVRRFGQVILTYWAFLTILFVLFRLVPGDPTAVLSPQGLSADARQELLQQWGFNDPLYVQYFKYMGNLLQGNLGISFIYREPVKDILIVKFWNTIFLMGGALIIAYTIGIIGGALLAWKRGSNFEIIGVLYALIARSSPIFWTGIVFIIVFAFWLDILPAAGMRGVGQVPDEFWARYISWDFLYHAILPMMTAAIYYMSLPMLLMRNSMLDVLNADFIEMKKSEGLSPFSILYKHAVRNSILPIITMMAIVTGRAVGGQVLLEVVFNWPGMGRLMVEGVQNNDYNLAMAAFFLMGSLVIFMNFIADLLYGVLDPRVTYE